MMNNFDTGLQEIIEERVSILTEIERAIFTRRYSLSSKHREIFSTQSISMIYSIWEGFVQKSFNLYIDELNKQNVTFYQFKDTIIIHHMENKFKQFREYPQKSEKKMKFFMSLKDFHAETSFSISRVINTESNVSFDVLNKLLRNFSLQEFTEDWQEYQRPNPNLKGSLNLLLRLRNDVAHGSDLVSDDKIDQERYSGFKKLIIDLMYEIRARMIYGLQYKIFLKDS